MRFTDFIPAELDVLTHTHVSTALYWRERVMWDIDLKGFLNFSTTELCLPEDSSNWGRHKARAVQSKRGHDFDSGIHAVRC